jgi:hypothetical protein
VNIHGGCDFLPACALAEVGKSQPADKEKTREQNSKMKGQQIEKLSEVPGVWGFNNRLTMARILQAE